MPLSRRSLLTAGGALFGVGAAGAVGVQTEVLPGRSWFYQHLHIDGSVGVAPDVRSGRVVSGSFASKARGTEVGWSIAYPPHPPHGGRGLPLAVALHGRGDDHSTAFAPDQVALNLFLADAVDHGVQPFAIASVDGGDTYWHDRVSGDDAGTMVVDELIPMLARKGLDTSRLGFIGWSMGGFGALHFGMQLGAAKVRAVSALSPAIWEQYADSAPGAFDSEADFAAMTPYGRQRQLDGIDLRIDCGESDPFYSHVKDYRAGFTHQPAGGFALGAHSPTYWRRVMPAHVAMLGHSLNA
ncbi:MAG: alpha/beta hydrolase-fold protein [Nocardioidaceae bacterium]|nr:alpha/beta hydrolase-fold protein [Nocardioidaceae bacterium]MCL2613997.1 alpha/beta hydrolase-fold protein [Nocardioidaceae bacterium]